MSHTAPDHIAAFANLKAAFSTFVLVGGLQADPTHEAGTAFLTVLNLEKHFRRLDGEGTNAMPGHLPTGGVPEQRDQGTNSP